MCGVGGKKRGRRRGGAEENGGKGRCVVPPSVL